MHEAPASNISQCRNMTEQLRARTDEPSRTVFQFSLRDLLGLMIVFAILLATSAYYWDFVSFGLAGGTAVLVLTGIDLAALSDRKTLVPRLRGYVLFAMLTYVGLCALAAGYMEPARVWKRSLCQQNVKRIVLALHHYQDTYGSFPPVYVADESGKPMHSWRVLVLPFMEQQNLYDLYDFNEPWDGPNNRRLLSALPDEFCCPQQRGRNASETNYVAVVGPATAWPGAEATSHTDFVDGYATTIMLVEVVNSGIAWTAPQDLASEEVLKGLCQGGGRVIASGHQISGRLFSPSGAMLGYADGHVEFLTHDVPTEHWRAVLQINDGKPTSESSRFYLAEMPP